MTDQKAWIYDPRDDSVRLLDSGGAKLSTVWAGSGSKLLHGYLDEDWVLTEGVGPSRPALWERRKVHGVTDWRLTVLPVPEGFIGMTLYGGTARSAFLGAAVAADGSVHPFHASRRAAGE